MIAKFIGKPEHGGFMHHAIYHLDTELKILRFGGMIYGWDRPSIIVRDSNNPEQKYHYETLDDLLKDWIIMEEQRNGRKVGRKAGTAGK